MNDPKYANPYPAQGYYQGPPVMPPPQYAAPPPPPPQKKDRGFLEGWYHLSNMDIAGSQVLPSATKYLRKTMKGVQHVDYGDKQAIGLNDHKATLPSEQNIDSHHIFVTN